MNKQKDHFIGKYDKVIWDMKNGQKSIKFCFVSQENYNMKNDYKIILKTPMHDHRSLAF